MPGAISVIIVEDLESDAQLVVRAMTRAGYDLVAERVEDPDQMRAALQTRIWDLVISDFNLPQFGAQQALEILKESGQDPPFILVSGTIGEETAATLMREGAHDYVMKGNFARLAPAVERELVQAEMRRAKRRHEAELRNMQERLNRAVSAGQVGLWDWNLKTNEVFFSEEWKHQLGYAGQEIEGDYLEWEQRLHPEDRDLALNAVRDHLANPALPYSQEFRLRHKDGSYRWILAQGSCAPDDGGRPSRMFGSHIDITDRRRLEDQFLQSQKMETVGRLAGGVAHDFNNLLTVILGHADFALESVPGENPIAESLLEIRSAADRAAALTRQLLAFSRKQVLQPRALNLREVVSEEERMLRRLIGEDIDIVVAAEEGLGHVRVDRVQIGQVILNLAINARDAMPSGGKLTIELGNADLDGAYSATHLAVRPGPYVLLAISDSGTGMDQETLAKIFEPFFTTKEPGKGSGLGLATVHGIVHQSGGHLLVYSEPGRGTSFKIYLPRVDDAAQSAPISGARTVAQGHETILIVEDEIMVQNLAVRMLSRAGYTVLAAGNGTEALALLEEHGDSVRLLITDVVMPEMGGKELARHVREQWPGLRVLYISGYTGNAVDHQGIIDPESHFLGKPFSKAQLTQKIRELLDMPDV